MPNWTYNEIKTNNPEIIPTFMDKDGNFDFNKLIPMPESLNIEAGSQTDRAIAYKVTERLTIPVEQTNLSKLISNSFCADWAAEVVSRVTAWAETASDDEKEKLYTMGQQYMYNYQNHDHHFHWYSWAVEKWGTKWGACDSSFNENNPCYISFSTAWSAPLPILEKMCELFPDSEITFHCEYEEGFVVEYENVGGELVQTNEYELNYDDEDEDWYEDEEAVEVEE